MKTQYCLFLFLFLAGLVQATPAVKYHFYPANAPEIRFTGRAEVNAEGALSFDWSGSHFTFKFHGSACALQLSDSGRNYYNIFIDGKLRDTITAVGERRRIILAEKLGTGDHTVLVQKRTEAEQGRTTCWGIEVDGKLLPAPPALLRHIEFIGDSHTCGYGTEGKSPKEPFKPETENCDLAWGCILARYFDTDYSLIAHSGQGIVRNWGDPKSYSDCTMRERMLRTFDMDSMSRWNFKAYRPDVVIIKLGTNDLSCDITPSPEEFDRAFRILHRQLREHYGATPLLYVAPQGVTIFFTYMQALAAKLEDPNLHYMLLSDNITNWDSDMGANFHLNHLGHCKMAMAVAPYLATITGWELPFKTLQ